MTYLIILLTTFLFYGSSLKYGFSQDDFFHISIAQAHSFKEFLSFFNPFQQHEWIFFRPISTQVFYFIFDNLFGLTKAPIPMHFFMLIIHALNGYLIYKLLKRLKLNHFKVLISSLIYTTSSLHFLSLYYIGATQQLLTTFFSLLAILAMLDSKIILQLIFLIFALLSKEIAIRTPFIMFLVYLYKTKDIKKSIKNH